MVHFVEGVPEWNRLGMGTGMNSTRRNHSFPFIKRLVLGEDSENLNHNCKQKWRKGLRVPVTHRPSFKLAEGPQFLAQYERKSRASDTFMSPQGAGGLGRSGWQPQDLEEQPHPRTQ